MYVPLQSEAGKQPFILAKHKKTIQTILYVHVALRKRSHSVTKGD